MTDPMIVRTMEKAEPRRRALGHAEREQADMERAYLIYVSDERYHHGAALARRAGIPRKRIDAWLPAFEQRWVQDTERFRQLAEEVLRA